MKKISAQIWRFPPVPENDRISKFLEEIISTYIEEGILMPGEKLPAYRELGDFNSIARSTMQRVYQRLEAKGWLDTKLGSGTFVSFNFPNHEHFYPKTRIMESLPIKIGIPFVTNVEGGVHDEDFLSIGFDTPGARCFNAWPPFNKMVKDSITYRNISMQTRITALNGGDYKEAILDYMNLKRNFMITENSLEVIIGREESLKQIFRFLLKEGDVVVNTSPKDKQLCSVLKSCKGVEPQFINMDKDFLQELKNLLSHTKIKAIHLRPQCSYPDSYVLESDICTELLSLAKQHKFYIVEEDDYHECWYKIKPFRPLIIQDHGGHVIYCAAFSLISPYLQQTRTIIASEEFITLIKENPLTVNPFQDIGTEAVMIDLMKGDKLSLMIKKMQHDMKDNSFASWMLLRNTLSTAVIANEPSSGLSIWVTFPDSASLMESIVYLEEKGYRIPYSPGSKIPVQGIRHVRVNFGTWDIEEIQGLANELSERLKSLN